MVSKRLGEDGHRRLRALAERFGRGNLAARLGLSEEGLDSTLSGYYDMSEEGVTNLGLLINALECVPAEARGSPGEEGLYKLADEDDVDSDEKGALDGVVDAGPAWIVEEHVGDESADDEGEWSAGEFGGVSGLREDTSLPDRELAEVMKQDMGVVTEAGARTLERIAVESERSENPPVGAPAGAGPGSAPAGAVPGAGQVMGVDDHPIMRNGLRDTLEASGRFEVVGQAEDGEEAVKTVEEIDPQVIVMDVMMPNKDGIDACRDIMELLPETRVLMLTASTVEDAVIEAVAAGATGYLQKYSRPEELVEAVLDVARGRLRIPGKVVREVFALVRGDPDAVRRRQVVHRDRRGEGEQRRDRPQHPLPHTGEAGHRGGNRSS